VRHSRTPQFARGLPAFRRGLLLALGFFILQAGCSRSYYRHQADEAVLKLVEEKSHDSDRWGMPGFNIDVDPRSRMFDPNDPDHPPMPPDDPYSAKHLERPAGYPGYENWLDDGTTDIFENPQWRDYLPLDGDGVLHLTADLAVELSLIHSTSYQGQLETLYLAALDASSERFRFDTQFFGGYTPSYQSRGNNGFPSSVFDLSTRGIQARRALTSGAEMVIGLANSLTWQFSGPNTYSASTLIDFTLVQPLLRGAGRDRVMERLTIAERSLLANVRQFELYRRGHYMEIITGSGGQSGLQRRGGFSGASGLGDFVGVGGGGFGTRGGGLFGGGGGVTAPGGAGGYIGMLQAQQGMRNQEASVTALRSSLAQLEAFRDAGRIDFFQVEQLRQQLFTNVSGLLNTRRSYKDGMDGYKRTLGLSPEIEMVIEGDYLDQFNLIDPRILPIQQQITDIQLAVGNTIVSILPVVVDGEAPPPLTWSDELTAKLGLLRGHVLAMNELRNQVLEFNADHAREDIEALKQIIPDRKIDHDKLIEAVLEKARQENIPFDTSLISIDALNSLPADLTKTLDDTVQRLTANQAPSAQIVEGVDLLMETGMELNEQQLLTLLRMAVFGPLPNLLTELSANVLEISLVQAEARAETVMLIPIELTADDAMEIARLNRLDWMNNRAAMVDSWRLVNYNANPLESNLDIVWSGDIRTTDDNPVRFRDTTGNLRASLRWDAPITRLQERNTYRQALIEYQQARRRFYQNEDNIYAGLVSAMRQVELNKINFEMRRAALRVAIKQVQSARLRLQEPPRLGAGGAAAAFGPTTAQNLISALSSLRNAQDDFLSVWVSWEVQRGLLDLNLGTMQLDEKGMWIDPGPIVPENGFRIDPPEQTSAP
jgi:outer membrane protein TolC